MAQNNIDIEQFNKKYLEENLTISECAQFFGCGKTTIIRYISKNKIRKDRKLINKNLSKSLNKHDCQLIQDLYFKDNLTKKQIAIKLNIKQGAIQKIIAKSKLLKTQKQKVSKLIKINITKEEMFDLYITQNFSLMDLQNRFKAGENAILGALKRFDIKKPNELRVQKSMETLYKNENAFLIDGLGVVEVSKLTGVSRTHLVKLYHIYKGENKTLTLEEIENIKKENLTNIENIFSQKLGFEKFDKKTDLGFNYQPDFKINDSLYVNLDGLYWHSSKIRERNYHFNMRLAYEEKNARIMQFWENEIYNSMPIIESMINNALGKSSVVGARKCNIEIIEAKEAREFLENNHLMGYIAAKHVGLRYNNELVSLMSYKTFGNILRIERFCNKINLKVGGGFSKLLKAIPQDTCDKIEYWVDLRYGTGNFLKNLGFEQKHDVLSWRWTDFKTTFNRRHCRANMDSRKLSEKEYANELKLFKIYDAGQRLYTKTLR